MKTIILFLLLIVGLSSCCDCPDITQLSGSQGGVSKDMAEVDKINGMYVFIKSEPLMEYDYLGTYESKWFLEVGKLAKLKGKKLTEILDEVTDNLDFNDKLEKTIDEVKQKHPRADAVIFSEGMSSCKIIKFKK